MDTFEELRKEMDNYLKSKEDFNKNILDISIKSNSVGNDTTEYDKCIICGSPTPYPTELSTDKRHCYIEGRGQLCINCCKEKNDRRFI